MTAPTKEVGQSLGQLLSTRLACAAERRDRKWGMSDPPAMYRVCPQEMSDELDYTDMVALSGLFRRWAIYGTTTTPEQNTRLIEWSADFERLAEWVGRQWRAANPDTPPSLVKFLATTERSTSNVVPLDEMRPLFEPSIRETRIFYEGRAGVGKPVSEPLFMPDNLWVKIVEMLQLDWAAVEPKGDGVRLSFINDTGGVFDQVMFSSKAEAVQALRRSVFGQFNEEPDLQKSLTPPTPPFRSGTHPNGPIYSSDRFWQRCAGVGWTPAPGAIASGRLDRGPTPFRDPPPLP